MLLFWDASHTHEDAAIYLFSVTIQNLHSIKIWHFKWSSQEIEFSVVTEVFLQVKILLKNINYMISQYSCCCCCRFVVTRPIHCTFDFISKLDNTNMWIVAIYVLTSWNSSFLIRRDKWMEQLQVESSSERDCDKMEQSKWMKKTTDAIWSVPSRHEYCLNKCMYVECLEPIGCDM